MSLPSFAYRPGSSIRIEETAPRRILEGWAGVYRATDEEERLFCVLLPGDKIARYPGCSIQALSTVVSERCECAEGSLLPFIRQAFRLSQYGAASRTLDFLFDVFCRLRAANAISGRSYDLPMTQVQLGELLGMSTVHVNRTLNSLPSYVRVSQRHVTIDDQDHLTKTYGRDGLVT